MVRALKRLPLRLLLHVIRPLLRPMRMARVLVVCAPLVVVLRALLATLRAASLALLLWFARLLVQGVARLEACDHALFHFTVHKFLDVSHQWAVVEADQGHRLA